MPVGVGLTGPGPTVGLQDTEPVRAGRTYGKDRQTRGRIPAHTRHIHGHNRHTHLNAPAHLDPAGDPDPNLVCHRGAAALALSQHPGRGVLGQHRP